MKTVFSKTKEVCDLWATQSQPEARTGSNTRFRYDTLYSYGTPIGRIVSVGEQNVALISHRRYSNSTATVIGEASESARAVGMAVFEVADFRDTESNLRLYERRIGELVEKIERAVRWDTTLSYRRDSLALIGEALIFASTFGVGWVWTGRNPLTVRSKYDLATTDKGREP